MKKKIFLSIVSVLSFFIGHQGFDAPNKKASLSSKVKFASSINMAMASTPEEDAAQIAIGLWEFAIESNGGDKSVYEFVQEILTDFSNAMIAEGFNTCSDIPVTGSVLLSNSNVTVSFSGADKLVPNGSQWLNSGNLYQKKATASYAGNEFAEIQYDCSNHTNIYFKYDFNTFASHDRIAEIYMQKGSNGLLNIELQTTCQDPASCGTKQNSYLSFHTPDGNEIKVIGTRTEVNTTDLAVSVSMHGFKDQKMGDIHFMLHTDVTNNESLNPVNPSVTGVCVDFNSATYIPAGGASDCVSLGASAANTLNNSESDVFGLTDIHLLTINALNVLY